MTAANSLGGTVAPGTNKASLVKPDLNALSALCLTHGIPPLGFGALAKVVRNLQRYKLDILKADDKRTDSARKKELELVKKHAAALRAAIVALPWTQRNNLDLRYFAALDVDPEDPLFKLDLGGYVVPVIEAAADAEIEQLKKAGQAGAPNATVYQVEFLQFIAQIVQPTGLQPASSGPFRDVCAAVFQAAGLVLSDRAVRQFMTQVKDAPATPPTDPEAVAFYKALWPIE
jgi:hypothetical protein